MRGSRPGHAGAPAGATGALGRAPVLHRRLGALRRRPAGGPALHRQGPDAARREQQCPPTALVRPLPPPHLRRLQVGRDGRGDHGAVRLLPLQWWRTHLSVSRVKPSPLGVFADELLDYIPERRIKDVTYFNPSDTAFPIGYNVLGGYKKEERDRAAASVVSVFNAIWNLSLQNPSIHSILGNGIAALMEFPNATLLWLPRFLTDDDWRKEHTQRLTNPTVRTFWQNDFDQRSKRDRRSASEPVLNRVQELFRDPIMANIFGQERKAIDIPRHLAERRILIVNLAKAKIGSENASLLGAFIIADIANAAYARIDAVAVEERLAREHQQSSVFPTNDFYLYIDEFQDMANAARFDEMFSQARN